MGRYIIGRLLQSILSIVVVAAVIFFLVRLSGDPTQLMVGMNATEKDIAEIRASLGLDKSLITQFGIFMENIFRGDFGKSIFYQRPVTEILGGRLLASLQLGAAAIAWSVLLAVPIGVYAAVKRKSLFDRGISAIVIFGQAAPSFWLGLMLMLLFAVWLKILPVMGRTEPLGIVLPSVTLGVWLLATVARMTRSSMLDVLDTEYVKLARIKGLSERVVIWKHAFRNALLPVLTFSTMMFISVITSSVTVETVFGWPGIGQLTIQGVTNRDFPIVQAVVIVIAAMYIMANLAVDILYAYINPKIRYTK